MSYQAQSATLRPDLAIQIQDADALVVQSLQALSVGQVIRAQAVSGANTRQGILVAGQYIPSTLPPEVQDGATLTLQVQNLSDQLLLKILSSEAPKSSAPTRPLELQLLQQNLKTFLDSITVRTLRNALSGMESAGAIPSATTPNTDSVTGSPQHLGTDAVWSQIEKILSKIPALQAQELSDPEKIIAKLRTLNDHAVIKLVKEASGELEKLTAKLKSIEDVDPYRQLREIASKIAQDVEEAVAEALLHELIVDPKHPTPLPSDRTPIQTALRNFLQTLRAVVTKEGEVGTARPSIHLREALAEAETVSDSSDLRQIAGSLTKIIQKLHPRTAKGGNIENGTELLSTTKERETIKNLEGLIATQSQLTQLNQAMEAIGEPVFILFPLFGFGQVGSLNVAIDPAKVDKDLPEDSAQRNRSGFERVEVEIVLPAIGKITISAAHRANELFLNLGVTSPATAAFLENARIRFTERLQTLGYPEPNITIAAHTTSRPVAPEWVHGLITPPPRVA